MATKSDGKEKVGIVVSDYYFDQITSKMLAEGEKVCKAEGVTVVDVLHVPGTYDLPLAVKRLLDKPEIDGVVAIGAIVKGETAHDEIIGFATAKTLQELSLQYDKPVAMAITGPRMTREQAIARIPNGGGATQALIDMLRNI